LQGANKSQVLGNPKLRVKSPAERSVGKHKTAPLRTNPPSLPGEVPFDRLRALSKRSASKRLEVVQERGE